MNVLFIGQIIPDDVLHAHYQILRNLDDNASNAFYNALLNGLAANGDAVEATSIVRDEIGTSGLTSTSKIKFTFVKYDQNLLLRSIKTSFRAIKTTILWRGRNKKGPSYALFNCLRISQSLGSLLVCKVLNIPTIAVVTDVPGYRVKQRKRRFAALASDRIGQWMLKRYDGYVLLSEEMAKVIRIPKARYCVIEGIYSPPAMVLSDVTIPRDERYTIMYAGALMEQYNIMNLVRAVRDLSDENVRLHIYGEGELVEEITAFSKADHRIVYRGVVPREEIILEERKASLLVNPRRSTEEYTRYSFPSKNIEYMASGTPVLFTKLPSMPREYDEYVNFMEREDTQGIKEAIIKVMRTDQSMLKEKAEKARDFILSKKSPILQAQKVHSLLNNLERM